MLNKIIAFSVRNKLLVGILVMGLVVTGAYNVARLPIDAVPDITNNQVMVITTSPSLGAADIERLITFPIEQATINIPGIIEQRSFSRFGLSIVTIVFNDDTDVYWARQQVSEKLTEIKEEIPPGLGTPGLAPVTTGLGEIFQYIVKAKPGYEGKYSVMELRTIQDWIVRRQLLGTKGVADVSSFGGKLKQYEIAVRYDRLNSYNLTISDIFSALEANNQNTGGAYIEKGPTVLYIRSEGLVKSLEDIGNIMVKTLPDGTPVIMRDVADIQFGEAIRYGAIVDSDKGEVAGGVVMMLKGANSSGVIKEVKERVAQIEKTLPEGVAIEPFLDRSKMVNNAIATVERNLLEGALIVIFVLVLFLGNLRAGLLVASVIPLSMLFAVIMMNLFGVSGNLMSLGALDFGLIIDGAVIIVEAVMHHLHKNKQYAGVTRISQDTLNKEVEVSAGKLMNAAVFGQVIILIVYLPILTLHGIEGKMFRPMAQTVTFAIIGAFLLSLTYIPMMSSLVLSKKLSHKDTLSDRVMRKVERGYRLVLEKALAFPKIVMLFALLLFGWAIYILSNLGGEFIPQLEEGDFAVDFRVLTGSSLTTTVDYAERASRLMEDNFPEVEKIVTRVGSPEIPTDPMSMEAADLILVLKPKKEWTSAKTFDELAEKMSRKLEEIPGVTGGFQFPVQMRFNELISGGRQDVVCKVFGEDLDSLSLFAERLGTIAGTIKGARDIYVETVTGLPQIVVDYNRAALAQYGLNIEAANKTLQAAFAGASAGQVFENERRFDLVVRLHGQERRSIEDVRNLLIATPDGHQVPLGQVADIDIRVGPNQIQREDAKRRITVGFNVRGMDVETVVKDLQQKVGEKLKLPPGYYVTYGGEFENLIAARARLSIAVPIALLLIFVLLYFAFHSVKQGLLIFSAIPLSAIGGVCSLWIRGMPFSISAGVGFIALFGVAVLNGIVLMTEFNQLKKAGVTDIKNRVLAGATTRLRPVLMTASVASLGFLPMALSKGAGAEVQRPLATVVIGGLITATFLTLVVLPILYRWLEERGSFNRNKKAMNTIAKSLLITVLLGGVVQQGGAQRKVTLDEAIEMAVSGNLGLKSAKLKTLADRHLEHSAVDIPFTEVTAEHGKMNSVANDTRFGLRQTLPFPSVYKKQRLYLQSQTAVAAANEKVVTSMLKTEVTTLFYKLRAMQERAHLLKSADSLFQAFASRQRQRVDVGDAPLIEKVSAEAQLLQVNNQLDELHAEMKILQSRLGALLNSRELLLPDEKVALKMSAVVLPDTAIVERYPEVEWNGMRVNAALEQISAVKAQSVPHLSLAYANQSIIGIQNVNGTDKLFTAADRFSAVQIGVNFPLFNYGNKAKVKAATTQWEQTKTEFEESRTRNLFLLQQLLLRHTKTRNTLNYFEKGALKQAEELHTNAALQLSQGEISFMEWMMIVNQSISIRADYIDAVEEWNDTIIQLNSFINN